MVLCRSLMYIFGGCKWLFEKVELLILSHMQLCFC